MWLSCLFLLPGISLIIQGFIFISEFYFFSFNSCTLIKTPFIGGFGWDCYNKIEGFVPGTKRTLCKK